MKEKRFNFTIGGQNHRITPENSEVMLFRQRQYQELDYLRVYKPNEVRLNIFRNVEFCRWLAGIAFNEEGVVVIPLNEKHRTFAEGNGWNVDAVIRDEPMPEEIDAWIAVEVDKDVHQDGSWDFGED